MNDPIPVTYNGATYGGYKKCPTWLKEAFRRAVKYTCMDCNKTEEEVGTLEPHRIKRGCEGGLYVCIALGHPISNVKMCCHNCHEKYNYSPKVGGY